MGGRRDKVAGSKPFKTNSTPSQTDLMNAMLNRDKFNVMTTGVQFADTVTQKDWEAFGEMVVNINTAIQWIIGDWLAYGIQREWGKTYEEAAQLTGYTVETLRDFVWVASSIDLSLRNDTLSFTHHRAVAHLPPEQQVSFLETAAKERWSMRTLRSQVSGDATPPSKGLIGRVRDFYAQKWSKYENYKRRLDKRGQGELSQIEQLVIKDIEKAQEFLREIQRRKKG